MMETILRGRLLRGILLGLMPKPGLSLRGDLGVLRGDGIETAARVYWHNKTTTFVSDIPGEVELNPGLWGEVRYEGK